MRDTLKNVLAIIGSLYVLKLLFKTLVWVYSIQPIAIIILIIGLAIGLLVLGCCIGEYILDKQNGKAR